MIKKFIHLFAIPSILLMGSCASTKTAQMTDQNDDVYYSIAKAREVVVVEQAQPEQKRSADYVTEDELYGDSYRDYGYMSDYTSRIYRFRNYSPSLGYYNSLYGYNYDPFYSSSYYPYNYYGSPSINIGIGIGSGFYNYNPWRYYGYNYGSNYWGPYSYYNNMNPYGYGGGFYGGLYNGGNYGVGYNNPIYTSPNYRPRPSRSADNISYDRGNVIGNPGGVIIKDANGNLIQSRGRAERYGDGARVNTSPNGNSTSSTSRPQPTARPERVNQSPPPRAAQPERIYTAPSQDRSSSPSNNSGGGNSGGGSSSGPRPSRGN